MPRQVLVNAQTITGTAGTHLDAASANWANNYGLTGYVEIFSTALGGYYCPYGQLNTSMWIGATNGSVPFTTNQYAKVAISGETGSSTGDGIGVCLLSNNGTGSTISCYVVGYYDGVTPGIVAYKITASSVVAINSPQTQINTSRWVAPDTLSAELILAAGIITITVYHNEGAALGTFTDSTSIFTSGSPGVAALSSSAVLYGNNVELGNMIPTALGVDTLTGQIWL